MAEAFDQVRAALMKATQLSFPEETAEMCLATDASALAVGAVL